MRVDFKEHCMIVRPDNEMEEVYLKALFDTDRAISKTHTSTPGRLALSAITLHNASTYFGENDH